MPVVVTQITTAFEPIKTSDEMPESGEVGQGESGDGQVPDGRAES